MTETDKVRIRPLDDKSAYALWRLRVESACDDRGLTAAFNQKEAPAGTDGSKFAQECLKVSGIIVAALGDSALRLVKSVRGKPTEMLEKLDARFDSKTTASKITKMVDLVSIRYTNPRSDITKHIDRMGSIVEQLQAMQASMDESLKVGILIASIEVPEMRAVVAAIKTLADQDVKWDTVAERLIEEWRGLKKTIRTGESSATAKGKRECDFCSRPGHTADNCWINPANPHNRLNALRRAGNDQKENDSESPAESPKRTKKSKKPVAHRAAMARTGSQSIGRPDVMMIDSGTTSHMTSMADKVYDKEACHVAIKLADDSEITATQVGVRKVKWQGPDRTMNVSLTDTLVAADIKTSLLSVPALVKKDIGVLFLPGKAMFLDLLEKNKILGYATQKTDGLYYISDLQEESPVDNSDDEETVWALMAVAKGATAQAVTRTSDHEDNEDSGTEGEFQETSTEDSSDRDSDSKTEHEGDSETDHEGDSEDVSPTVDTDHVDSETEETVQSSDSETSETDDGNGGKDDSHADLAKVWHLRLGHVLTVGQIRRHIADGSLPKSRPRPMGCEVCVKTKFRKSYPGNLTKAKTVGHLHADVKGMIKDQSDSGARYYLVIVDEYSRYVHAVPMVNKSEASEKVLQFVTWFERQTGRPVKSFYSDGGREFNHARTTLEARGVDMGGSTAYTPQSNGLAERHVGVILTAARAALHQARLPVTYWDYAVQHVAWCKNMVKHSTTKRTPYEMAMGHASTELPHVRPFGCRMLYHPVTARLPPFKDRLLEGVCLGHSGGGVYKVLTVDRVVLTKHVHAFEDEFPGTGRIWPRDEFAEIGQPSGPDNEFRPSDKEDSRQLVDLPSESDDSDDEDSPDGHDSEDLVTYHPAQPSSFGETDDEAEEAESDEDDDDEDDSEDEYEDAQGGNDDGGSPTAPVSARPRGLRQIPRVQYTAYAVPKAISTDDEPRLSVALKSAERAHWLRAIKEEFKTLIDLGTWVEEKNIPKGTKLIRTGVILKLKRDENGVPARFKGRLVARGNEQTEEFEYVELYAPVACIEAVRILLAVAAAKGWCTDHLDIKGAFLYALLPASEEVWVKLPTVPGVPQARGQVVKLRKSLYGLRQAPKLWYELLARSLKKLGFRRSRTNDSLFISKSNGPPVYLLVYVDDILVVGDRAAVQGVKKRLSSLFKTTDLGTCTHFVGMKIERRPSGLFLSQRPFAEKIIELAGMTNAKPTHGPLPLSHPLYEEKKTRSPMDEEAMSNLPYREVLGSLLFLATRTRPDLATVVSMLGKYQEAPLVEHWKSMKSVIRYLIGTLDYGIFMPSGQEALLEAWSDADWARDHHKRRSRSGYLVTFGGCPVVWASRLQSLTAQSTTEAEFISLAHCVREIHWIRATLEELHVFQSEPTTVYQDNLGTISWTTEVQGLRKVKHIGIRYHYVRDAVDAKTICVEYTPSTENKADGLTKVLVTSAFDKFRRGLMCLKVEPPPIEEAC